VEVNNPSAGALYKPITTIAHSLASGAAGWVAVDISTHSLPIGCVLLILLHCTTDGFVVGVRPTGSAEAPNYSGAVAHQIATVLSTMSAASSIDVYRDATANVSIEIVGYFS
jgi:hypothetical protein